MRAGKKLLPVCHTRFGSSADSDEFDNSLE